MITRIFVFGSNLAGRHGLGAALDAVKQHGAIYGRAEGLQGNSYAIPTRDKHLHTLPLRDIAHYVNRFIAFAGRHPELTFYVTKIGCGLAGYREYQIRPLFTLAPPNCDLPTGWRVGPGTGTITGERWAGLKRPLV